MQVDLKLFNYLIKASSLAQEKNLPFSEYTDIAEYICLPTQGANIFGEGIWLTACHFRSTSSISGPVQVGYVCLSICLSVCVTRCLFASKSICLLVCLGSSIQKDLAHCLPSATWLAWKRLGWNWFEVASKHMKDWCVASTAATWIVPSHLSNVPVVPARLQTSLYIQFNCGERESHTVNT